MDPLDKENIVEEARNIIKRLAEKEKEKNTTPFKDWPETPGIPYELEPKRRNSGLDKRN